MDKASHDRLDSAPAPLRAVPAHWQFRCTDSIATLPAPAWDALAGPQPFLRHAYLAALEQTGCVGGRSGWRAHHATLWQHDTLIGAAPLYLKHNSWGEYVFDWAWADAYQRHGLAYYPKWLAAVPFTPVPGPRLLGRDALARQALLAGLLREVEASGLSSLHILFPDADEAVWGEAQGMLLRHGVQFHWENAGYPDFEAFLAQLAHDKRKKIRQERRKVTESGVRFRTLVGSEISAADWAHFELCYRTTYALHHSTPYLKLAFFERLGAEMGPACVLFIAEREGRPIGASLCLRDEQALYGRYWGALEYVPCLHFEACYYQPIAWAIEQGIGRFEGGAQGEHKLSRGLLPVRTRSLHWLRDARFRDAVADFLARESGGMELYLDELSERAPFKREQGAPPAGATPDDD